MDEKKTVPSLPFSGREYITFSLLLAKLALEDQDKKLCDLYFDLEYRARIANKYEKPKELEEL